jgi:hypothetical protein
MAGIFCWLMLWRVLKHYGIGTNVGALAVIAFVSVLFTALPEVFWIWAYQGYKVSEIFSIYFTFDLGVPPPWKILALGLLIVLGATIRQTLDTRQRALKIRKVV